MKIKSLICIVIISSCIAPAMAMVHEFTDSLGQMESLEVEYWTGSGDHETILVVDWNKSGNYASESHAFGYSWDGSATSILNMLDAIALNIDFSYASNYGYLSNVSFTDLDGDQHTQVASELGSVNMASTGDVYAEWGSANDTWTMFGEWEANGGDLSSELIADGQLEGVNFFYYFQQDTFPYENLDVTFVPEPATMALMGFGAFLAVRRKKA